MKVLLDACVWGGAKAVLSDAGHEVEAVADWSNDPGDDEILAHAARDGRILVTLDKDFGELVFLRKMPHAGIVRLVGFRAHAQGEVCVQLLHRYSEELATGALITAEPGRVRIRK